MNEDIQALREEIAKLRERIAVLEADKAPRITIDYGKPLRVGSPQFIPAGSPLPAGTITCSADARQ